MMALGAVDVDQVDERTIDGLARETSGEVGCPVVGRRVGVSSFRTVKSDCEIWSARSSPRGSGMLECHRGS